MTQRSTKGFLKVQFCGDFAAEIRHGQKTIVDTTMKIWDAYAMVNPSELGEMQKLELAAVKKSDLY